MSSSTNRYRDLFEGALLSEPPNVFRRRIDPELYLNYRSSMIFFLIGAILYLIVGVWGLVMAKHGINPFESNDESLISLLWFRGWDLRNLISFLAPLFYLMNALNDYIQTLLFRKDRQTTYGVITVWIYALGACFDMISTTIQADSTLVSSYVCEYLGDHLYLVYGVLVLLGRGYRIHQYKTLTRLADTAFVIGSAIDVTVVYFLMPNHLSIQADIRIPSLAIVISDVIWLLSPTFLLAAGFLERRSFRQYLEKQNSML